MGLEAKTCQVGALKISVTSDSTVAHLCKLPAISRGANFLATLMLRPNASDLTGSFRYLLCFSQWIRFVVKL